MASRKRIEAVLEAITNLVDDPERASASETAREIVEIAAESDFWKTNLDEFLAWWDPEGKPY